MIKAVFIDIDNTLLNFNKSAEKAMEKAFDKHGIPFSEKVFPIFKSVNDALWHQIEKKEITREFLHDVRFNRIFERLNVKFDGHIIEKEFLENLNVCAVPFDGAKETLEYLSKKYILCAASNAFYNQQVNRLKLSGLFPYFNHLFISEKIGAVKPEKKFFDGCFSILNGIKKEEVVMVGDSISADITGAKEYGLKTVWFNPDNEFCSVPDITIKTLTKLKEVL